jgi:hypothetical protein
MTFPTFPTKSVVAALVTLTEADFSFRALGPGLAQLLHFGWVDNAEDAEDVEDLVGGPSRPQLLWPFDLLLGRTSLAISFHCVIHVDVGWRRSNR